ncbi:MAG: DUF1499 domain-containing protein [Deltaproteobacteria bacterium]|jgi:uncharacterized protein (DUF1499 family)|nr:DUF1499 domain-containing protein [Deltaproteobacteria bacterium]MBW2496843.1 DUF1499 domain-containing protein [Deltaproteobacteria bacterium]
MASLALIFGLVAGAVALIGLIGAYSGLLAPLTGFQLFAGGGLLGGLLALLVSAVGIATTRGGRDLEGRKKALLGGAIAIVLLSLVLVPGVSGLDYPPINDISTDLEDPPSFAPASTVPDYAGRDMSYPPEFVAVVRDHYPDLQPIDLPDPPTAAFEKARAAAESLGWEIVASAPDRGVFDARDVTAIFRFVDDVTVRVVPRGTGSRVDIRSKSRDGRGDLGANAIRIRAFAKALR